MKLSRAVNAPIVIPAKVGIQLKKLQCVWVFWIPACAGMTALYSDSVSV